MFDPGNIWFVRRTWTGDDCQPREIILLHQKCTQQLFNNQVDQQLGWGGITRSDFVRSHHPPVPEQEGRLCPRSDISYTGSLPPPLSKSKGRGPNPESDIFALIFSSPLCRQAGGDLLFLQMCYPRPIHVFGEVALFPQFPSERSDVFHHPPCPLPGGAVHRPKLDFSYESILTTSSTIPLVS